MLFRSYLVLFNTDVYGKPSEGVVESHTVAKIKDDESIECIDGPYLDNIFQSLDGLSIDEVESKTKLILSWDDKFKS